MSKTHVTRGRRVAVTRAGLQNPTEFVGPQEPQVPLTLQQRLLGGEMTKHLPALDLAITIMALTTPGTSGAYPARVRAAARKAADAPSAKTAAALERVLRRELDRDDVGIEEAIEMARIANNLVAHQAAFGSAVANARMAAAALNAALMAVREGRAAPVWLALQSAILFAEDSIEEIDQLHHVAEPRYPRLAMLDARLTLLASELGIAAEAQRLVDVDRAILDGGVGVASDLDPQDIADLADALRIASPAVHRPPLSRAVFPSMRHLPQPAQGVRDRGDSPRALGEPVAEVPLPLAPAPDPRAFAEDLRARFPWAGEAIEAYATDLVGAPFAAVSPRILVGGAGGGKTEFARAVLSRAGLAVTVYGAAGMMDGGSFAGTSRQWGSWRSSVPAQGCITHHAASHGIIVDEVEKAGNSRRWGRLDETLLPFLERSTTARAIFDPAFECALDLSAVSYVLTANSLDGLTSPLRDRCQVLRWPMPRRQDLPLVAAAIVDGIRQERGLSPEWMPPLDEEELDAIPWRGGSMRPLRRMIDTVLAARHRFASRH